MPANSYPALDRGPTSASYDTISQAYSGVVTSVLECGEIVAGVVDTTSVGSDFGHHRRPTRELLGHAFTVRGGGISLPVSVARRPDLAFCLGQVLWVLAQSDDLDWIRYYNPRGVSFSDDGRTLSGAIGPRLGHDLRYLKAIVDQLSADRQSRRAILPLIYPTDLLVQTRDFPCGLAVQFLVREDRLTVIAYMRSQSALMLLPYDAFMFRTMQHVVASELGLPPGPLTYLSGSLHIYEDEVDRARSLLDSHVVDLEFLPVIKGLDGLDEIFSFERQIRTTVNASDRCTVTQVIRNTGVNATDFWSEMKLILLFKAASTLRLDDELKRVATLLRPEVAGALALRGRHHSL